MTELDPSIILQAKPIQLQSPLELATGVTQLRNLGLQGQNAQIQLEQNQRNLQDSRTIADLYRSNTNPDGSVNHAGVVQGLAQAGLGDKIPAYQQQVATAQKDTVAAQAAQFDLHKKRVDLVSSVYGSLASNPNTTQDDVINAFSDLSRNSGGAIPPEQAAAAARDLPGPQQLHAYLVQKAMMAQDASKQLEVLRPKFQTVNLGGSEAVGTVDQSTGKFTQNTSLPKTLSPDTQATIAKDYAVAGLNPDGSLKAADASLVDQIGQNRIIPSARLQATPRGQAILAAVEAKYPGYDITTAEAKQKAAKDFTTGKEGASLRSIGTATKHLDMLGTMIDNLDNTESPAFNAVANLWKTQTGDSAPTSFNAAKQIVAQEVIKAIVAGGGGVAERAEADGMLKAASSPEQLRDVVRTYKTIMGAQHESLLQQRDAAGLSRTTLPDYIEGAPGATPPGGPGRTVTGAPPVPVKSDADYAALKSGTRFLAPDGTIRTKP